jgi:hypothetical protein
MTKFTALLLPLLLLSAPAFAKHGKAGLWSVTSTTEIAYPPALAAAMKKEGQPLPAPKPVTFPMCMSQAEVDSDSPPHMDRAATGCDTRIVKQTPGAMTASMLCKGSMKGTGTIQVSYAGAEHYSGFYSFKGSSSGNPIDMTTRFKGDWVKADCGKTQPYKLRTQ